MKCFSLLRTHSPVLSLYFPRIDLFLQYLPNSEFRSISEVLLHPEHSLLLESLEIVLTIKGGFNVVGTAGNGVEALELLKKHQPDVMLIDLNMPGMGGIELIKKVKKQPKNILTNIGLMAARL